MYSPNFIGNPSITGRTSPTYATSSTEDTLLMDAYRDLNQRRGLPDFLSTGNSSNRRSEVISISSDDEHEPKDGMHNIGDAALPLLVDDDDDDDVVDELDLDQLNSYSLGYRFVYSQLLLTDSHSGPSRSIASLSMFPLTGERRST